MGRAIRGVLLAAAILALTAGAAHAQAIGSIFGKVTDQSGGVLPGVTVTITGTGLQQPLVGTTQASGAYQFPSVPIGTYSVTFELSGFKKAVRQGVVIDTGFQAQIDMKLELGTITQELTVTAAAPVVDTKKTTTGATFSKEIFENIPTARDPWQIINMTPGVQAGLNVGGSSSGQQVGLSIFGTGANVQWNLEGGSITDLSSNSSPSYFNFDSFEQIQVVTGGGDVSVQSSGLSINLVTKSGSNVFKGTALMTFENDKTQWNNVTEDLFNSSSSGFLSGNPIQRIGNYSVEYGGPIQRNRLWWWAAGDWQDINTGVLNFFDGTKGQFCQDLIEAQTLGQLSGAITYDKLEDVQQCLQNDKTTIKDLSWKFNYQLNAANKFQYLFQSDNKYRNRRGASSNTLVEAVTQQTSDMPKGVGYWGLPLPTHSLTHTLILTDRLVFNNQFTYVHGGFYLDYQDVPPQGNCEQSKYTGALTAEDYMTGNRASADCFWNVQSLSNRTTGISSRSLSTTYETARHSWEAKSDGTYFLSNALGGDHSLKFGVGWRRNPITTFRHRSGGARVTLQCYNNDDDRCGGGLPIASGSNGNGLVPRSALVGRDGLDTSNDWWTYNGYIQESFSRGKLRLNGGVRYDWQTSKYVGGCVPSNVLHLVNPGGTELLPAQCEDPRDVDSTTGKKLQPFSQFAPRVSATYDLVGNGKTQVHASYSLYFATKITLANAIGNLGGVSLTWGNMGNNGTCSSNQNTSCWQDLNIDGFVQANELSWVQGGLPNTPNRVPSGPSNFDADTGILNPGGNTVDPSAQIGRTREAIVGMQHELIPNLAVGVDYVYRNYDRGTTGYLRGYQPGCESHAEVPCVGVGFPLSQIYTVRNTYTDPITGITAPYYTAAPGTVIPSGLGTITVTDLAYETYHGVILQANKRFSDRWQMNASITLQANEDFLPTGSFTNPTGVEFTQGHSEVPRYLFKVSGAYAMPYGFMVSGNLNVNDGGIRTVSIDGPGSVPLCGAPNACASGPQTTGSAYNSLSFQPRDATRFDTTKLLDLGVSKTFALRGGRNRVKVMLDVFNVFNANTVTDWGSNNMSELDFLAPDSIIPPRVLRFGAQFSF